MVDKCVTILVFKDGDGEITRTLEGFIQLKKGDIISLPRSLGDSSDGTVPTHSTHTKDDSIRKGAYAFQSVNRIYKGHNDQGFLGESIIRGHLEIEYHLSRLDE